MCDEDWPKVRRLSNELARRGTIEQKEIAIEKWLRSFGDANPRVAEWARKQLSAAREQRASDSEPDYTGRRPWRLI